MGLHDKRISEINDRNRSKIEARTPFAVAMRTRDHNVKVVKQQWLKECPKDCKYIRNSRTMHVCLDCFKNDRYKAKVF